MHIKMLPPLQIIAGTGGNSCGATRLGASCAHSSHTYMCRPIITESHPRLAYSARVNPPAPFSSPSRVHSSARPRRVSTISSSLNRPYRRVLTPGHRLYWKFTKSSLHLSSIFFNIFFTATTYLKLYKMVVQCDYCIRQVLTWGLSPQVRRMI